MNVNQECHPLFGHSFLPLTKTRRLILVGTPKVHPAPMVHPCIFGAYKGLITYIFCPKTIGDRSSMYEIAMRT